MPKYDTLAAVASALGVTLPAILADEQPSDIDEQLRAATAALSPRHKAALLAAAQALGNSEN